MKNIETIRSHILSIRKTEPELAPLADRALAALQDRQESMAALARKLKQVGDPETRDRLYERCLPKALNTAFEAYVDMTRMYDLRQAVTAAVTGIDQAIRDYAYHDGTAFSTVADIRIREAIDSQCGDGTVRVRKQDVRKALQKLKDERTEMEKWRRQLRHLISPDC